MTHDSCVTGDSPGKIIGRESLAYAAAALLLPFGMRRGARRTPRVREQRTIVFVHGFLANPSCFAPLRAYLRLRGHRQMLGFAFGPGDSVERAAIDLKRFLKQHVRGGRVDLVCHSLGGLVARLYLSELGGGRRVDRCITLGTPHRGTYNAYWVPGRTGLDLRPDSGLLRRLQRRDRQPGNVRHTAIVAGSDNIILPRTSAAGRRHAIVVEGLGHMGLLFSPRVMRLVADRLAGPLPGRRRRVPA